jgi:hypothetical protein
LDVEHLLGHDVFQPPFLVLDLLQPFQPADIRAPYLASTGILSAR